MRKSGSQLRRPFIHPSDFTRILDPFSLSIKLCTRLDEAARLQPLTAILCLTMVLRHELELSLPCVIFWSSSKSNLPAEEDCESLSDDASFIAPYCAQCATLKACFAFSYARVFSTISIPHFSFNSFRIGSARLQFTGARIPFSDILPSRTIKQATPQGTPTSLAIELYPLGSP